MKTGDIIHGLNVMASEFKAQDKPFRRDDEGYATVTFKVKGDALHSFLKLLAQCEYMGNVGHSFSIDIDPKGGKDYHKVVGFDGDGADRVKEIMVNGEPLPEKFEWQGEDSP